MCHPLAKFENSVGSIPVIAVVSRKHEGEIARLECPQYTLFCTAPQDKNEALILAAATKSVVPALGMGYDIGNAGTCMVVPRSVMHPYDE